MATGKYPRQPFADEGLPQDWGEPEEMPEVNDYLGPAPWAFGNWRFVVVELTADERVMLTKLAREQRRDTDAMAAALIRQGLRKKGPGSRGQGPGEERSALEPGTWNLEPQLPERRSQRASPPSASPSYRRPRRERWPRSRRGCPL